MGNAAVKFTPEGLPPEHVISTTIQPEIFEHQAALSGGGEYVDLRIIVRTESALDRWSMGSYAASTGFGERGPVFWDVEMLGIPDDECAGVSVAEVTIPPPGGSSIRSFLLYSWRVTPEGIRPATGFGRQVSVQFRARVGRPTRA
jgi:hypothetical protein